MIVIELWLSLALSTYFVVLFKTRHIKKPKNYKKATFKFCLFKWWRLLPNFVDGFEGFTKAQKYRFSQ